MQTLWFTIALVAVTLVPNVCNAQVGDDPFSDYLQRSDSIALWAGNAEETNSAIHTPYPWPRRSFDTRIPMDGRQGVGAIQRMYSVPSPFAHFGTSTQAVGAGSGNATGTSTQSPASPSTPMQPVTDGQ